MTRTPRVVRCAAVAALSVAGIFASSAVASASPVPHTSVHVDVDVRGTVAALSPASGTPTSVTVQPRNPGAPSENVLLSPSTVYRQGGATVSVSALVLGVPVSIEATGSPATAALVTILTPAPVFVDGTVTSLSPSTGTPTSVTIQPRDGHRPTLNIDLGTGTLYYEGGSTTTVSSLIVGSRVHIEATGEPATATMVEIQVPRPVEIDGIVTALNPSTGAPTSLTVLPFHHNAVALTIDVAAGTVYRQGGSVVTVADLLVGSKVDVWASGNPETATTIRIAVPRPVHVEGTVIGLSPSSGTPTSVTIEPNGFFKSPVTLALGPSTLYWQLKAPVTVSALLVGSHVELSATGDPLTATVVHISAPLADITLGSVTAVTSTSLTVQPNAAGSSPVTFTLDANTTYFAGREKSTISEVNVGDEIRVAAAASAPTVAVFVTVRNMVIIGKVTSVASDVISVTGFYGAPLSIDVTAGTTYEFAGQSSSLSAVLPGELVVGIGPAMSGVTDSVSATTVWIGTKDNPIFYRAWLQHQLRKSRHHF